MSDGYVYFSMDDFSLVPSDLLSGTDVPFIDLILVQLGYGPAYGLSAEPAVREYIRSEPGLYPIIRELGAAVGAAGIRARDNGLLKSGFDDNLKLYTPEEIWNFDLAIDVMAVLAALEGLAKSTQFRATQALRDLDRTARGHTWKKELKRAGEGPAAFRELRARVPRHVPHPGRSSAGAGGPGWM
jgi:hypothetical protein